MAGAVEGILASVRHPAHWRVSMPIVVGAAEYQHDIGVILHQTVSVAEAAVRCQVIPRCREHGDTVAKDAGAYHQQSSGYAKRNHRRLLSRLRLFGFNSGRGLARLDERCAAQLLPRLGRKTFAVTRLSLRDKLPTLRAGGRSLQGDRTHTPRAGLAWSARRSRRM